MGVRNTLPSKTELIQPTLTALRALGGQATTSAIDAKVAELMELSDEVLQIEDNNMPGMAYSYRMRWARTELKQKGLLSNPTRGVWVINDTTR